MMNAEDSSTSPRYTSQPAMVYIWPNWKMPGIRYRVIMPMAVEFRGIRDQ